MKKIVIASNTAWTVFNHREGLIKVLQEHSYEVHTVAPLSNFTDIENPGTIFHEVKNLERKGKNPFSDLFLIFEYCKIYREIKPEAVLSYTIKTNIYSAIACRFAKIPIICTVNGLGAVFDKKNLVSKLVKNLYRFAFKQTKAVVFQNKEDCDFFIGEKIIKNKNIYITQGSGVNLKKFLPQVKYSNKMIFILISRMLANKGIFEFVEAGKQIKKEYPKTEFILLGPVDYDNPARIKREFLESLKKDDGVYYVGATDNVKPYIADSSAVILPSYYREGVPKILIEALAMGKPVITTKLPGCCETVIDSVNGFFVKEKSSDSLYSAIKQFILLDRDKQKDMGFESRKLAEEKFDEQEVIRIYMEILDKYKKKGI